MQPYLVIRVVENGFTIEVCGVVLPRSFVASSPEQVTDRIAEILPHLVTTRHDLSALRPASA